MNQASKDRRTARHAAEKANRPVEQAADILTGSLIDLKAMAAPRDLPALSWLNGKTHPQNTGGRSGVSGTRIGVR